MKKYIFSTFLLFLALIFYQCSEKHEVILPQAFAIVVDDMGWMHGKSLNKENGPYRLGIERILEKRDYKPFVIIGKDLGIRFQGSFILSEFDMENILAKYPTTTEFGEEWDNSDLVKDSLIRIMDYIKKNAAYLEFGIHGVRHEYWENGESKRAEWYDAFGGKPWPKKEVINHMNCFASIMGQYGLTKENGQSFPESFVPTAYAFQWNPEGNFSTGKIMHDYGVKYGNTNMQFISDQNPPIAEGGGIDHGLHFLNRYQYGNDWNEPAKLPFLNFKDFETDFIEAHWTNFLSENIKDQDSLNNAWVKYLRTVEKDRDHYLAKNTEQLHSQWLYRKHSKLKRINDTLIIIDNTDMPNEVYHWDLAGNMLVAIKLGEDEHISYASINDKPIASYEEKFGYAYIYLPPLDKKVYTFSYSVKNHLMKYYVNNTGTYNIYDFMVDKEKIEIDLKMYGTQEVDIKCFKPDSIHSENPYLSILDKKYNSASGFLKLKIHGRDMQGERGKIVIYRQKD